MSFNRRTVLDLVLIPVALVAFGALCWYAVYAGPKAADKLEAEFEGRAVEALMFEPFDWARIEVKGRKAVVSGTAPTQALRDEAIQRVRSLTADNKTTVEDATYLLPPVSPYTLRAEKMGGAITLDGVVPGPDAVGQITELLAELNPDSVADFSGLDYRDGEPEGGWVDVVLFGLQQLDQLVDGQLTLTDKRIFLEGQAADAEARLSILETLMRPPADYGADANLIGNAVWSARYSGGVLRYNGEVPDGDDASDLLELTNSIFSGRLVDNMSVAAMRERDWMRAVELALPLFLEFQSGAMIFKGDELEIQGTAPSSVLEYLREDMVRSGTSIPVNITAEDGRIPLQAFETAEDTGELPGREVCQAALDEALALGAIQFERSRDEISRSTGRVLDGVLTVMMACPHLIFEIQASTHADGRRIALQKLTEDRQMAFGSYFIAHGVPLDQIEFSSIVTDGTGVDWSGDLDPNRQVTVRLREY